MSTEFLVRNPGLCGFGKDSKLFMACKELIDNATDSCRQMEGERSVLINLWYYDDIDEGRRRLHPNKHSGLKVSVVDDGIGINIDTIETIGKPFSTAKEGGRGLSKGCFGLGLKALMASLPCTKSNPLVITFCTTSLEEKFQIELGMSDGNQETVIYNCNTFQNDSPEKSNLINCPEFNEFKISLPTERVKVSFQTNEHLNCRKDFYKLIVEILTYVAAFQYLESNITWTIQWNNEININGTQCYQYDNQVMQPPSSSSMSFNSFNWRKFDHLHNNNLHMKWFHRLYLEVPFYDQNNSSSQGQKLFKMYRVSAETSNKATIRNKFGSISAEVLLYRKNLDLDDFAPPTVRNINKLIDAKIQIVRVCNGGLMPPENCSCFLISCVVQALRKCAKEFGIRKIMTGAYRDIITNKGTSKVGGSHYSDFNSHGSGVHNQSSMSKFDIWLPDHWCVELDIKIRVSSGWDTLLLIMDVQEPNLPYSDLQKTALASGSKIATKANVEKVVNEGLSNIKNVTPFLCSVALEKEKITKTVFLPSLLNSATAIAERSKNQQLKDIVLILKERVSLINFNNAGQYTLADNNGIYHGPNNNENNANIVIQQQHERANEERIMQNSNAIIGSVISKQQRVDVEQMFDNTNLRKDIIALHNFSADMIISTAKEQDTIDNNTTEDEEENQYEITDKNTMIMDHEAMFKWD